MSKISGVISVLAAAMFFSIAPAMGDEYNTGTDMGQHSQTMQQGQKDECLLVAMNCPDSYKTESTDQKIDRLKKEIAKGKDVYTEEELKTLNEKLDRLSGGNGGYSNYL